MTKKGSTARIAAIIVAVMLCVALLTTVLVACSGNTITFDTDGGTEVDSVKKTVNKSPVTTKDGFKFDGWYTEKEFQTKVTFPYTAKGNVTLYAKWVEETDADRIKAFYNIFGSALENSIGFVGSRQFGVDVNLGAMGVGLNIKANIDPKDLSKVAANIELLNGDASVMNIFADDEFLYLVNDTTKKRLKDFNLEAMLSGIKFDEFGTSSYGTLIGTMLNLVLAPESSTYNKEGNTYTVEGSLAGISELLGGLNIEGFTIPAEVTDLLSGMNLRIKTTIENDSIKDLAITVVTPLGEVAITSNQLKLGNKVVPAITLPDKTDKDFDETYGLNFSIEGTASLINKNADYTTSNIANFDYKIYVDYNIFGALRNSFGGNAVGAVGFFGEATQDSKIFIDISHNCSKNGSTDEFGRCSFCKNKLGSANGSILSLAYSPSDFHGSNDIKLALNAANIIPEGLIYALTGENQDSLIKGILGDYLGTSIDPAALIASLANINTNSAPAKVAETAGFNVGSLLNPNVLQIVANAFDLAKSITLNPEGLQVGVTALLDLLANAIPGDMNIGQIAQMFFGKDTDILNVSANAMYGDPRIQDMDLLHKFMIIDENNANLKNFRKATNFTPALTTEFVKGADGNAIISTPTGDISTHDAAGRPLPLSPDEIKALLANGYVKYNYVNVYGEASKEPIMTKVMAINGYDEKKVGEEQYVTVITDLADGGALSSLLSALQIIGLPLISLPGAMVETVITTTDQVEINFKSNVDTTKTYEYGDAIDASAKATATYFKGTDKQVVKEVVFEDTNALTKAGKFNTFLDQSYTYSAFGKEFNAIAKTKGTLKKPAAIKHTLNQGGSFELTWKGGMATTSIDSVFTYGDNKKITQKMTDKTTPIADSSILVKAISEFNYETYIQTTGYQLTFTESGVYTVVFDFVPGSGMIQEYVFTVNKAPTAGYNANVKTLQSDLIEVVIGRTNQIAESLRANTVVTQDGTTLQLGTDYVLQTKNANGEYVKLDALTLRYHTLAPQVIYIRILKTDYYVVSKDIEVTFRATDYNNFELFTVTAINAVDSYAFEAVPTNTNATAIKAMPEGKFITVTNNSDIKVSDTMALKFEVKNTSTGEYEEKTIGKGDAALYRLVAAGFTSFYNELSSKWEDVTAYADTDLQYTNGSGEFPITMNDTYFQAATLHIYITDVELMLKDFDWKLSLTAKIGAETQTIKVVEGSKTGANNYITTSNVRANDLPVKTGLATGKYIKIDKFNIDKLALSVDDINSISLQTYYWNGSANTQLTETQFTLVSFGVKDSGDALTIVNDSAIRLNSGAGFEIGADQDKVTAYQYILINDATLNTKSFTYIITITMKDGTSLPILTQSCGSTLVNS